MCFGICACGKSEEVTSCETLINSIGEVTLESESAIQMAEEAYANLPEEEKSDVDNYSTLIEARITYDVAVFEDAVTTLDKADILKQKDIDAAYEIYDNMSETAKANTTKYSTLENLDKSLPDAEERYCVVAANAVKDNMKVEDSFKITEIAIKKGNTVTPYAVYMEYTAVNSFGGTVSNVACVDITSSGEVGLWGLGLLTVGQERATQVIWLDYIDFDSKEVFYDPERIMRHLD